MNLLSTIMFLLYYSAALAASEVNKLYSFIYSTIAPNGPKWEIQLVEIYINTNNDISFFT